LDLSNDLRDLSPLFKVDELLVVSNAVGDTIFNEGKISKIDAQIRDTWRVDIVKMLPEMLKVELSRHELLDLFVLFQCLLWNQLNKQR
jgi:hypothetical protein